MPRSPRRLSSLLGQGSLADLSREARAQESLLERVRECLPAALREHCRHCRRREDTLILLTDTASGASLLRFQAPQLLERLLEAGESDLREVKVRTEVTTGAVFENGPPRPPVSAAVTEHLAAAGRACADPTIGAALERLARTLAKPRAAGNGDGD